MRLLAHVTRESDELFLMGVLAICLSVALLADLLGLSLEVGAFVAGLMLSGPEDSERTLRQVRTPMQMLRIVTLGISGGR
jgi:CPA2 family monovalent cation:H+ antiporter-2